MKMQVEGEEVKKMQVRMKTWCQGKEMKKKDRGTDASRTVEGEASAAVVFPPITHKESAGTRKETLVEKMRKMKKQKEEADKKAQERSKKSRKRSLIPRWTAWR